jgi:hypothetical protein
MARGYPMRVDFLAAEETWAEEYDDYEEGLIETTPAWIGSSAEVLDPEEGWALENGDDLSDAEILAWRAAVERLPSPPTAEPER